MAAARRLPWAVCGLVLAGVSQAGANPPIPSSLFSELRWRMIGPQRGGRTVAAVGVPGQPGLFYVGVNNGGVWQTSDHGRIWRPIFDDQPTGSIGAIAVAPPNLKRLMAELTSLYDVLQGADAAPTAQAAAAVDELLHAVDEVVTAWQRLKD